MALIFITDRKGKMIRGKMTPEKIIVQKCGHEKNDTEKVVQKYAATKKMQKIPGWENICGNYVWAIEC